MAEDVPQVLGLNGDMRRMSLISNDIEKQLKVARMTKPELAAFVASASDAQQTQERTRLVVLQTSTEPTTKVTILVSKSLNSFWKWTILLWRVSSTTLTPTIFFFATSSHGTCARPSSAVQMKLRNLSGHKLLAPKINRGPGLRVWTVFCDDFEIN
jgi:hypothetical protein